MPLAGGDAIIPAMLNPHFDWLRRVSRLRPRGPMLAILFIGLLAVSPTPAVRFVAADLRLVRGASVTGRPSAMFEALAPLIALEPSEPRLRLVAADAALNLGQPGVALDLLSVGDLDGRRWTTAGCLLARAEVAEGDPVPLSDLLDHLSQFCPPGDPAWSALVDQNLAAGDPASASVVAARWAEVQPANPAAHLSLGLSTALVDPERALSPLKVAIALTPAPPPLATTLAQAIEDSLPSADLAYELAQVGQALAREGRWDLAVMAFSRAVDVSPDYVEALAYLGLAVDRTGGDGEQQLTKATQAVPTASLPHVFLAQHWVFRGEFQRAADELRTAQTLAPDSPAIAAQLGGVLASLGDLQSALSAYQHAAALAPDSAEFQGLLASFSLEHEIDVAGVGMPAARRSVLLEPRVAAHRDQLGFSYYLHGNPEMAEDLLLLALRDNPASPAINYHLGLARLSVEKTDMAILSLREAADLDPGGLYAMLATRTLSRLQP
jgi:tetratricopeptide (TPR) repeat protein